MPDPITRRPVSPPPPPASAPPPSDAAPDSTQARDQAAQQVDAARINRVPMRSPAQRLAEAIARVYDTGGTSGLRVFLETHPEVVTSVAGTSRDQVRQAMTGRLGEFAAASAMEQVQDNVSATMRQQVVRTVRSAAGDRIAQLGGLRVEIEANLDVYRNAPPESDKGRLASALGVRGDAGDLDRVRAAINTAIEGYESLIGKFTGQTWEVGDFEQTAASLANRSGMGTGLHGTFTGEALSVRSDTADRVHVRLEVVEVAHITHELSELLHGAAKTGPLAVALGGFFLAREIHHAVQDNQARFQAAAHTLGIR